MGTEDKDRDLSLIIDTQKDSGGKGQRPDGGPEAGAIRRRERTAVGEEDRRQREERLRSQRQQRSKRRRRQVLFARLAVGALALFVGAAAVALGWGLMELFGPKETDGEPAAAMRQETAAAAVDNRAQKPQIQEDFLTPNPYSRPGEALTEVTELFVHYTANAGTSAAQNRHYFENLGTTGETSASAHFIIGYEGEIIQCLPLNEIGYAVKQHNYNSISIECCYLEKDGRFTDATYESLIALLAWLMKEYDLDTSALLRHYDCGGKLCPLYYVEHEDAWEKLKKDVADYIAASSSL